MAIVLLGACGFEGGGTSTVDASSVDAAIDAPPTLIDAPPDAFLGDWSTPVPVDGLNSDSTDDDPSLTGNLRRIYFASARDGGLGGEDIYTSTRETETSLWDPPVLVDLVSSIATDSNVEISADDRLITFTSFRNGTAELFWSQRVAPNDPWPLPTAIPGIKDTDTQSSEYGAQVIDDGLGILYCSSAGSDEKIYFAQRPSVGVDFQNPILIASIDSFGDDCDVWLVDNTLYFTSNRGTSLDTYTAERVPGSPLEFTSVTLIEQVAGAGIDGDPWVSADQRTMYLASNRAGGAQDLYISTR